MEQEIKVIQENTEQQIEINQEPVLQDSGEIIITSNGITDVKGYATANVNVGGTTLDLSTGIKFGYSSWSTLPDIVKNANWADCTNMGYMFNNNEYLTYIPLINTSNNTNLNHTFSNCKLIEEIPATDTSKVTDASFMCYSCSNLKTIPLLDFGNVESLGRNTFLGCSSLINLGGFKDIGKSYSTTQSEKYANYQINLSSATNLTHDSIMNVINNLYDIASKGVQVQELIIHTRTYQLLSSEEKAIATNKGWHLHT